MFREAHGAMAGRIVTRSGLQRSGLVHGLLSKLVIRGPADRTVDGTSTTSGWAATGGDSSRPGPLDALSAPDSTRSLAWVTVVRRPRFALNRDPGKRRSTVRLQGNKREKPSRFARTGTDERPAV